MKVYLKGLIIYFISFFTLSVITYLIIGYSENSYNCELWECCNENKLMYQFQLNSFISVFIGITYIRTKQ